MVAAFAYSLCHSLDCSFFVSLSDWHTISDVMSVTYVSLCFLHLAGLKRENHNALLRYIAFSLAWLFKLRDGPDGSFWETLLVLAFAALFAASAMGKLGDKRPPYRLHAARNGVVALAVSALLLAIEMAIGSLWLLGLAHLAVGAAAFYLWSSLPPMDKQRDVILGEFM